MLKGFSLRFKTVGVHVHVGTSAPFMKRHGKGLLLVDCRVRIDAHDEDWSRIKSQVVFDELVMWQRMLFGATALTSQLVLADAETKSLVVCVAKPGVDQLRAASVLVTSAGGVPLRLIISHATRHAPSRRPPP